MSSKEHRVRQLDPRSLRGIAHPLRLALLSSLREYGPATATKLAARLGESSGATSYHLRQLAEYGFVEEDTAQGTGRERWWRSVYHSTRLDSTDDVLHHADPDVRGALHLYLQEVAAHHALEQASFLGSLDIWPQEWREASDVSDFTLRLSAQHARDLVERLHELIESYRAKESEEDDDAAEAVRIHLHAFPRPARPAV